MNEPGTRGVAGEVRFLLTHSAVYGLGSIISQVVSFLLLPLYTHHLTPADYGVLETIDVSNGIIGIVVTLGIMRALARFYYESEEETERHRVVSTAFLTYLLLAALALPTLLLLARPLARLLLDSEGYAGLFRLGFLALVFGALNDIGVAYLRVSKQPFSFISVTTARLVTLILLNILFIVGMHRGVAGVLYSTLIANVLFGIGVSAAILRKTGCAFSPRLSLELTRFSVPILPSQLGNVVVKQSDKYFILYLASVADMGIYSLSLKIGNAVHYLLTNPFNMAYVPRRFELMKREDAAHLYGRVFTYYIFVVGFFGLAISLFAPEILRLLAPPQFHRAREIVPLVVVSMILFGTHSHFDFGILFSKRTKHLSYIGLACAAVQVALNWFLISRFAFVGAVGSSILSLGLQAFLLHRVSRRYFAIPYEFWRIGRFAALALLCYGAGAGIRDLSFWSTVGLKLLVLVGFVAALPVFRIVSREESTQVRALVTKALRPRFAAGSAPG